MGINVEAVLNIAHRGARAFAPENTLVAFAKAKTLGCEMFEMDVQMTSDGEIVVFHDDTLLRCTDAKIRFPERNNYLLADFSYQELSQLDAGSWYVEQLRLPLCDRQAFLQNATDEELTEFVSAAQQHYYASGDIKIPSLAETLCLASELGLRVNIELKAQKMGSTNLVDAVLAIITAMKMDEQVLISSFNHEYLQRVRQQNQKIAVGVLTDMPLDAPVVYLRKSAANAYHVACLPDEDYPAGYEGERWQRYLAHIQQVTDAGFAVNVWTCNHPDAMRALCDSGVNGIISDYPNRVQETKNMLRRVADQSGGLR